MYDLRQGVTRDHHDLCPDMICVAEGIHNCRSKKLVSQCKLTLNTKTLTL